jgi:DNA-binding FadR family transcriptional regulator
MPSTDSTPATDLYEPINPAKAYQMVAEAIEKLIVSGRVRPGEAIGTEAQLVKQFGVNRSTIREGIRLLEQSGLIRRDSSRRLFASLPYTDILASRISRDFVLHEITFRELWDATIAIESAVVGLASERISVEAITELRDNIEKSRQAAGNPNRLALLDLEFHSLIAKAANNRVLQLAREPENKLFLPTTEILFEKHPPATGRNIEAHCAIVEAMAARDKDMAVLWMQRHVKDWRKGFEIIGKSIDDPIDRSYAEDISALHAS